MRVAIDSESTSQSSNISAEVDDTAAIEGAAAATPAKARGNSIACNFI